MTIDELNKLTDDEVRVRVAERMGWKMFAYEMVEGFGFIPPGKEHHVRNFAPVEQLPNYLADLNAAFTLVEKLRREWNCDIFHTRGPTWKVVFNRLNYVDKLEEFAHKGQSLARAICIAFLAVTEQPTKGR